MLTYNQSRWVREALHGAFSQTYSPMEIIISDDCSHDNTFEIIQQEIHKYRGPHHVIARRNKENLGIIGHLNKVMELARGELIVAGAGDDISLPQRTSRICDAYLASEKKARSIFSNAIWLDVDGRRMNLLYNKPVSEELLDPLSKAARYKTSLVTGCTHAWKREVFEFFGPLAANIGAEDTSLPFRSALLGKILYIHEPLVLYRREYTRPFMRGAVTGFLN